MASKRSIRTTVAQDRPPDAEGHRTACSVSCGRMFWYMNPQPIILRMNAGGWGRPVMVQAASAETLCEVCAKSTARKGDLLCGECSRAFTLMLDLLSRHAEVDATDLDRMREVFQWRIEKTGAPSVTQTEAGVHDEECVSSPAPPDLLSERTETTCEVCAKPLVETDYLLCSDCFRALTIVLDLLRESAPLVRSWLDAHTELTPRRAQPYQGSLHLAGQPNWA